MFSNALKSFSSNIAANYHEKSPAPISHCGPWKIYDAKKKKTNQPASIWVFDRKSLDNGGGSGGVRSKEGLRAAQDEVMERLKHEASLLARLRHPCILELVEPVEETRSGGLQFVTELVTGSLTTLLKEKDDEEKSGAGRYVQDDDGRRRRREVEIDELEIQKGLLQVAKALEFLHESANLIHGNLTPDAVIVNAKSDWKLCGLAFAISSLNAPAPPNFDPRLPSIVQLQLDYAAPDLVLDQTLSTSCDLFSLGILVCILYNHPHQSPIEAHNSAANYRRILSSPQSTPNASNNFLCSRPVPRQLSSSVLPQLITRRPAGRMTARDFQKSEYFDNILVSTLRFLDQFPAKTPSEKAAFMRGLPKILPQFPRSVLEKKILPGLVDELRDGSMLALVLPNIFQIAENATARIFSEKVLKRLKEVFVTTNSTSSSTEPKSAAAKVAERERETGKEGGLTVILSKLQVIKEKTTSQEFKEDVLPLVFLALDSPTHALQDLALRSLPIIMPKLDFPTLKNEVFPVVATVFTKTSSLGIKIRGLEAFRVLCGGAGGDGGNAGDGLGGFSKGKTKADDSPVLDKYTVQEKVIPLLKGIKTKEPAVMMETLSVFREIGKTCDREVVAMDILPTLWAMSFGPLLGLEQFKSFMATIKFLTQKIEVEQIRKLQELSSTAVSGQTAGEFLSFGGAPGLHAMNGRVSPGGGGESDFERLVFGKKDSEPANDGFEWQQSASPNVPAHVPTPPPRLTTGAQKFSWSSPSPTIQQQQQQSVGAFSTLQPSVGGFGSTTAFPAPMSSNRNTGGALDWSAAMEPPSAPAPRATSSGGGSGAVDWSSSAQTLFPANTGNGHRVGTAPQMLSGLSLGNSSNDNSNSNSHTPQNGFASAGQRKAGGIQLANFGSFGAAPAPAIRPPPPTNTAFSAPSGGMSIRAGMNDGGMNAGFNKGGFNTSTAKKVEPKKGLDQWESLI